jgi:hypothetical protein
LEYFASIGRLTKVYADIEAYPALLSRARGTCHSLLLTARTMLPLRRTRQWLQRRLARVVGPNGGAANSASFTLLDEYKRTI